MECLTLKKSNCKNCYRCIRNCPVKSIRFSGNQAYIISNECILCGRCVVTCPQNAKQIVSEMEKVKYLLMSGDPVIVSLAPSFIANYEGAGITAMREALQKLGFTDVEETALGATVVAKEYDRLVKEEKRDIIITSCCHSVNLLIQKHFPTLVPYLADVMSPMQAHCKAIKARNPQAKTVFVGPCVAKKDEAWYYEGIVDAVLTFDELTEMLKKENIEIRRETDAEEQSRARLFPTTGGVLKTMAEADPDYTYMAIDGVDNCIAALKDISRGMLHHCVIEMSACYGSCVGGPAMEKNHRSPVGDYAAVTGYAGKKHFQVSQPEHREIHKEFTVILQEAPQPSENEIRETLRQMGKTRPADELNCGSCGYNTCREKAVAILQGKAEISMCLPFLKDKAENFSDTISRNTPNGLIVLNEAMEVQQINPSALRILNLRSAGDILGDQVERVLEPEPFVEVLATGRGFKNRKMYLTEYDRYVEMSVIYDHDYRALVCILRDITEAETRKEQHEQFSKQTLEITDKVVEKQMRIVQEIASLLGETAAETKIALTKLKESITHE